jgi:glucose 1-dehydrogenase
MTSRRLLGKVALITGSDSGIGQASAVAFAHEGADVVVTYLHDEAGAAHTKEQVEAAGRRAIVVQLDISDEAEVSAAFDAAVAAFGTVDILVNSAGVDASGTEVGELSTTVWDTAMRTNLYGPFFCCRRFVQERKGTPGGGGKIINVTSVHADIPNAGGADYDCSKGAVRMLTRTLALELAPLGINVNSLAPGMVLTPFNQAAIDDPALLEEQVQSIPFKRAAEPAEIARLAVFLASPDADYCTGSTFTMDGGLSRNLGQGA